MKRWFGDYWGVLAAAGFLLLVVLPFLDYYGLWFDEIFSIVMSRSFDSIVQMVRTQENNMLLHYLFLWLWQPLGDGSEYFLRSSSVLLVLLSLLPLHAAAKRLANSSVANITVLFYVTHLLVLEHARTCRGYSLALLMACLVLWRWVVAWQSQRQRDWLIVGAVAGLGVWAHYFAVFVPAVLVFAMLWRDGWKQPWRYLIYAFGAFILFSLPIVLTRPPDGAAQIGWAAVPTWQTIYSTLWMLSGSSGLKHELAMRAILISCVIACALQWKKKLSQWRCVFVGLAVGLLLAVAAVLAESFIGQPMFVYRFFTPLVPVYCMVVAAALCAVWRWLRIVLLLFVLLLSAYDSWKVYAGTMPMRFWWKPVAQQLLWQMQSDDVILVYPSFLRLPVDYYLDAMDAGRHLPRPQEYASAPYRAGGGVEPAPDWPRLQVSTQKAQRVWLIADEQNKPSDIRLQRTQIPAIRSLLLQQGKILSYDWHYGDRTLQRYDALPELPHSAPANMQR